MALNITKALKGFKMADHVDLDCGAFALRIRQAAVHNEAFRAGVTKKALAQKRKSLVPQQGTMTGNFEADARLFAELVVMGWGNRDGKPHPLVDDDGNEVAYTPDVGYELFVGTDEGKVLFGKVMQASVDETMFALSDADKGN